jgi:hypothetical protein
MRVFKPYAGVEYSCIVLQNRTGGTDKVWFYDMKQMDIL